MRLEPTHIILEPMGRNTAPAIAVAALLLAERDENAILAVQPSDHVISNTAQFQQTVRQAAKIAAKGQLVLFGIPPTTPHTGYGYIKQGSVLEGFAENAFKVAEFREKPNEKAARTYLKAGGYFWNSGIFVFSATSFIAELERYAPDILSAARAALEAAEEDLGFLRLDAAAFAKSPAISIDYAVMEKTAQAAMLPLETGWNDIGSWRALWDLTPQDAAGNAVVGPKASILEDTTGCYVHASKPIVTTLGVENLIIVDTPDALLVADKARAEDVGKLVDQLKASNRPEHASHIRDHRPWGWFEPLSIGTRFQVKMLHVKPGEKLSLQMHHHRAEHWVVVSGTAKVTIGDTEKFVHENESVYIFPTQWHRLENPGKVPLRIIEVQLGCYLGEDDIIRSEDIYNRPEKEE